MNSKRKLQISNTIKRQFSEILAKEVNHVFPPHVLISVTDVQITPDVSLARIYLSIFNANDNEEIMDSLQDYKSEFKSLLARRLKNFRKLPDLEFHLDNSLEQAQKLDEIFRDIGEENENKEE